MMIPMARKRMLTTLLVICILPILYLVIHQSALTYTVSSKYHQVSNRSTLQLTTPSVEPAVKRILLVTYGRSGSTFTSYILKEAPRAFFFFEPFRPLLIRNSPRNDLIMSYSALGGKYMKPQEFPISNLTSYERQAVDMLGRLFDCDISKFPVTDYYSPHFGMHGDIATVSHCLRRMFNDTYLKLSHYLQCLLNFWNACQAAPIRIFKTIRLPLRSLFGLMRTFPDLRVVYLARDPRAILTSQRKLFGHAPMPVEFCRMVVDDVSHFQLLQKEFPGRAVMVRYEDISSDPLEWTRRLYKALHLDLTPKVVMNVRRMTSARRKQESHYGTFRADPQQAANKWRTTVQYKDVQSEDAVCGEAYHWLGYKRISNESVLRNVNLSLVGPPTGLSLL